MVLYMVMYLGIFPLVPNGTNFSSWDSPAIAETNIAKNPAIAETCDFHLAGTIASYSWNLNSYWFLQNQSPGSCDFHQIRPGTSLGRAAENPTTSVGPNQELITRCFRGLPSPSMWCGLHCLQMFIVSLFRDGKQLLLVVPYY